MSLVLPALLAVVCMLLAEESRASCIGKSPPVALAATCVDGACSDVITERQVTYWDDDDSCGRGTRPIIGQPGPSWPTFAQIADRLGARVTNGIYEIWTDEMCIHRMGGRNSWTETRERECRARAAVRQVSEDPTPAAYARLRSAWNSRERLGLAKALPTMFFASTTAIGVAVLATALIVAAPWVLASRAYGSRERQVAVLLLGIPAQVLIGALVVEVASHQPMPVFGEDGGGELTAVIAMMICLAALVISAMLQFPFAVYHVCRLAFRH